MARTVISHYFPACGHAELLAVLAAVHVDEIDHDYAAHVAQAELARYLVGSSQVHFQRIAFLVIGSLGAVARIDVDDMQRFSMLDNDISSPIGTKPSFRTTT